MKKLLQKHHLKTVLASLLAIVFSNSWAQLSITTPNVAVTENFDGLPTSGNGLAQTGSIFGSGWSFLEGDTNANLTYDSGTGSGTSGNTYNFGVAGTNPVTDRAFGMLQSGSLTSIVGFKFTNNTGTTITSMVIGYTGEIWRLSAAADNLAFSYHSGNVALNTGSGWNTVAGLAFTTPATGSAATSDGNLPGRRTVITPVTISVNIPDGTTYTLRWVDASGSSSAGMGIDDFSIKLVPAAPTVTTTAVTSIGQNGATLNGSVNPNGLTVDASFEYGTSAAYGNTVSSTTGLTGTSPIAVSGVIASGLSVNTQYHYRAVATLSGTPTNGSDIAFYTLANTPAAPVVDNATISSLDVTINSTTENGNPAGTKYAIREVGSGNFVHSDGALGGVAWLDPGTITVTGLNSNTSYTFEVKARNGDNIETFYGPSVSASTLENLAANLTLDGALPDFGNLCTNASAQQSFTFSGANLDGSDIVVGALPGYGYSLTQNGTYTSTLNISYAGSSISAQVVWVQFSPTLIQSYDGNIQLTGGNLSAPFDVAATGSGINTNVSASTGAASPVATTTATLAGSLITGCSSVTAYGVEYSLTNGFADGSGTAVAGSNLSAGNFSVNVSGLDANTVYYFKAYATDGTGTYYGSQVSFTTSGLAAPNATASTDIQDDSFTANWDALEGAASYRLDVSTSATFGILQTTTDLIFSEYVEGSGSNKYIEIYNGTGASVNLADYQLKLFANGGTSPTNSVTLSGTLANGATIVYRNGSAPVVAGAISNAAVNFNGDDTVGLFKISTSAYVDIFGAIGEDPGTAWTVGGNTTVDKTLVRNADVLSGITTSVNGFPTLGTEWTQFNIDTTTNLGSHTFNSNMPSFVPGYEDLTVNGTSQSVTGLTGSTTYHYRVRGVSANSTSPNSNVIDVTTANTPAAFGSISQVIAVVCDGSDATFNVTGLLPDTTSVLTFDIDNGAPQTVNVIANGSGFGSFTLTLVFAENGQTLTVTSVDRADFPGSPTAVNANNTVVLSVSQNLTYYQDADADGFGNPAVTSVSCDGAPAGYVADNTDCDDQTVYYQDIDGDGFGSNVMLACGTITNNSDCNDNQLQYVDADNDGFGSTTLAACGATNNTDCDDTDNTKHTGFDFYTDADNDGYGTGTPVNSCAVDANTPPAGFASNNTDCDDTKNTVHPGAVEIGYNLIDDDCDGFVDEGFPPKVTVIQGAQCNTTLAAIDTQITANLVAGAQGYRWRITTMSGPSAGQVQFLDTALRTMKITQLANYAFATQYKVEVGVYFAGFLQPFTPSSCTVTTPSTTTQLTICGQSLTSMSDVVYANIVPFATGYRFRITDPVNALNTQVIDRPIREFRMTLVTAFVVQFGKAYNVEVAVRNTDGSYLAYGNICSVTTPLFPTTSLQDAQCDNYAVPNNSTQVYAVSYPGAIAYAFLIKGTGLPVDGVEVIKSTRTFTLSDFPGLMPGATYDVRVRLIFNANDPAGPYGKTCTIVTPGLSRPVAEYGFNAVAYPNPFADSFNLDVDTAVEGQISVKVYDMTGRLLENTGFDAAREKSFQLGQDFPSGVYNVIISQGENVRTLRVIKR